MIGALLALSAFGGLLPLSGVDPVASMEDLRVLDHWIDGAKIVGVGESAHASRGYLQLRDRITRYLVQEKGFRVLLIEDGYLRGRQVDAELQRCASGGGSTAGLRTAQSLLDARLYGNEETQTALEWACSWNRAHPRDALRFRTVDIHGERWQHRDVLRQFTARVGGEELRAVAERATSHCYGWDVPGAAELERHPATVYLKAYGRLPPASHRECLGALYELEAHVKTNWAAYSERVGAEPFTLAMMALRVGEVQERHTDGLAFDFSGAVSLRDATQAWLAIQWMSLEAPQAKGVFLAHNLHVSRRQSDVIPPEPGRYSWRDVRSAGENLVAHFGDAYRAIGITAYQVSSSRDGDYPLPTSVESLELELSRRADFLIVDPRTDWIRAGGKWWLHYDELSRDGSYMGIYAEPASLYDAVVFLRRTEAARALGPR